MPPLNTFRDLMATPIFKHLKPAEFVILAFAAKPYGSAIRVALFNIKLYLNN